MGMSQERSSLRGEPDPVDLAHARPAQLCERPEPFADDELCLRCGHTVAALMAA
jgi:hypothetical protein